MRKRYADLTDKQKQQLFNRRQRKIEQLLGEWPPADDEIVELDEEEE
jgi:hypothetical protein